METRIGLIGIIVEDLNATEKLNQILHDYGLLYHRQNGFASS